jgi:hypothetical protein
MTEDQRLHNIYPCDIITIRVIYKCKIIDDSDDCDEKRGVEYVDCWVNQVNKQEDLYVLTPLWDVRVYGCRLVWSDPTYKFRYVKDRLVSRISSCDVIHGKIVEVDGFMIIDIPKKQDVIKNLIMFPLPLRKLIYEYLST